MSLGKRKLEDSIQIDLTPMLDVVFILLIFFIVTAAFIDEVGLEFQQAPIASGPSVEDQQNIVFYIAANDDISLDGRRVDIRSVRANVERLRAANPTAKVIIHAQAEARTATYVRIADQAREAGIEDVVLVPSSRGKHL